MFFQLVFLYTYMCECVRVCGGVFHNDIQFYNLLIFSFKSILLEASLSPSPNSG